MPEIRRAILDDLRDRTGQTWDETPDSLIGQLVAVFAEREAAVWELAEAAYLSAYPATAEGVPLDLAVSYAGVRRVQESASVAQAVLYGAQGTLVPAGAAVDCRVLPDGAARPPRFRLADDVLIGRDAVADLKLSVTPGPVGMIYSVTVGGAQVQHTRAVGQSDQNVAAALGVALIAMGVDASSNSDAVLRLQSDQGLAVLWSSTLTLIEIGSPGILIAEDVGPIAAPTSTLTVIPEPAPGWASVTNTEAAEMGGLRETDAELRRRYSVGVYRLGAGTIPSIRANLLQDVPGVTSVAVFENITDDFDAFARPPHSVEAVVEGGDEQAIAERLRQVKPAGIPSIGNTLRTVRDESGYPHPIRFSRPDPRLIWLRATLTTTTEESVPGDVAARAAAAMVAAGAQLQVGQDVHLQRIAASVFAATSGVARVVLTAAATYENQGPPQSYGTADLPIGERERAAFSIARVTIS